VSLKFNTATALKQAVSAARGDCLDALRKDPDTRRLWLVSRGACIRWVNKCGEASEADAWPFNGTAAELAKMRELAGRLEVDGIYIEGGFNGAESGRDYADGAYDPWGGEWSVCVFFRGDE